MLRRAGLLLLCAFSLAGCQRFSVFKAGETTVMVDNISGKAWELGYKDYLATDSNLVWFPIAVSDAPQVARK